MSKIKLVLSIVIVILSCSLLSGCQEEDEQQVDWGAISKSVVLLVSKKGSGSAFSISHKGYYVTNEHVIAGANGKLFALESISNTLTKHPAKVIWSSKEKDLAIIRILDWKLPALPLTSRAHYRKNMRVTSIGFPFTTIVMSKKKPKELTNPSTTRGGISRRLSISDVQSYEHSATIKEGNSGGPLVDNCGSVIGINSSGFKNTAKFNDKGDIELKLAPGTFYAIQTDELIPVLDELEIRYLKNETSCDQSISRTPKLLWGTVLLALFCMFFILRKQLRKDLMAPNNLSKLIRDKINQHHKNEALPGRPGAIQRDSDGNIMNVNPKDETPHHTNTLILQSEQHNWPDIRLTYGQKITLGRDPNGVNQTFLSSKMSKKHAAIRLSSQGNVEVLDLGSTNGTFLDHRRVGTSTWESMAYGQRLLLGSEEIVYRIKREMKNA